MLVEEIMSKTELLLAFIAGSGAAVCTTSRGANCQAAYHFVTLFVWPRVFGEGLPHLVIFPLDWLLNGLVFAVAVWVLVKMLPTGASIGLKLGACLLLLVIFVYFLGFAFPMKDCL